MSERRLDGQADAPAALALDAVDLRYGRGANTVHALRGVSLAAHRGEFVAVMGPSGSGKSSLVHVAAGLVAPTSGTISIHGDAVGGSRRRWAELRRRTIGVVFQRLNLVPTLSAIENVMVPLILDGHSQHHARTAAREALHHAGLIGADDLFPDDLSGGQQQRVAIARALVGDRLVLLADEPTGALDTATSDQVVTQLAARASEGAAVVMVTHESRLAAWADRVVYLHDGRLVDARAAAPTLHWSS